MCAQGTRSGEFLVGACGERCKMLPPRGALKLASVRTCVRMVRNDNARVSCRWVHRCLFAARCRRRAGAMSGPPASSGRAASSARGQLNARTHPNYSFVLATRRVRAHASAVEATPAAQAPDVQTFAPSALTLESGALSPVVRHPSASPHDVFRCSGCTETACQVRSAVVRVIGNPACIPPRPRTFAIATPHRNSPNRAIPGATANSPAHARDPCRKRCKWATAPPRPNVPAYAGRGRVQQDDVAF